MYTKLNKSKITDWWIAESDSKMTFFNILSNPFLMNNLLVVGYLDKENKVLATSTNRIVKVTKKGVITSKGTFYPFEEAHDLYLSFLILSQNKDFLIATNWKLIDNTMTANILRKDTEKIEKDVVFDFTPSKSYNILFTGDSKILSSKILLSPFSKRDTPCLTIFGVPDDIQLDIYRSSFALEEETVKKLELLNNFIDTY